MLPYDEWLEAAERLPEGREDRIPHNCGDGDVLVIGHTRDGYRAWCHRCHEGGFKPHGRRSLDAQLKAWREADEAIDQKTVLLPLGCVDYGGMSGDGLIWLSRGGITRKLADQYGLRFHPASGRVVLPVYRGSEVVYYQARAVSEGQKPKYLNPKVDRSKIRFVAGEDISKSCIVVTEDILSAIRVGDIEGYTGCSILGTTASAADLNYISQFKRIILWFDPDEAGHKCTRETAGKLALMGCTVIGMTSEFDPKIYTKLELESMLNEQLRRNNPSDPEGQGGL